MISLGQEYIKPWKTSRYLSPVQYEPPDRLSKGWTNFTATKKGRGQKYGFTAHPQHWVLTCDGRARDPAWLPKSIFCLHFFDWISSHILNYISSSDGNTDFLSVWVQYSSLLLTHGMADHTFYTGLYLSLAGFLLFSHGISMMVCISLPAKGTVASFRNYQLFIFSSSLKTLFNSFLAIFLWPPTDL